MHDLTLTQIWRYPVKSLGGEQLESAMLGERGIEGDRAWGLRQLSTGLTLTARRRPELLFASARIVDGDVVITLPDGSETADDVVLSSWLGEDVALIAASDESATYETPIDAEHEDAAPWVSWNGPVGSFHDSGRSRVSLVSTDSLGNWDIRRFRTNLVVEGGGEDDLVGSTLSIGRADVMINKPIDRCVMVTRPQPGLERDLDVLRTINRDRNTFLSIGGTIVTAGRIGLGDRVVPSDTTIDSVNEEQR